MTLLCTSRLTKLNKATSEPISSKGDNNITAQGFSARFYLSFYLRYNFGILEG